MNKIPSLLFTDIFLTLWNQIAVDRGDLKEF